MFTKMNRMPDTLTLHCGCVVHVVRHPETHATESRVIQSRGKQCAIGRHTAGIRVFLWELLPERPRSVGVVLTDPLEDELKAG